MMDVSLADVARAGIAGAFAQFYFCTPARVESYDSTKQKAVVQPLIKRRVRSETSARATQLPDVINDVPVVFPGAGDYSFTFPVAKGDIVLLVFADQSLDVWLASGSAVDPKDDRRCDVNDAIAIPGLRSFASPVSSPPTDAACISVPTAKQLRLGDSGASEAALLGDEHTTRLSTLVSSIGTAVGGIPGGAAAGTAIATALTDFLAAASLFKSDKVKVS
jgi:hypothetical protein